jgi:hypothetical protein
MDIYVRRDPEDPANLVLFGMDQDEEELWIASHAELLTPRMRMLDGIPVNTPLVGVQQQIERIVGTGILPPERQAVYDAGRVAFDAFVDSVRATAPEEFLPEEIMAPLVAFAELNAY